MSTSVVLQSNYVPWKGYFDLIHDADIFVFYDDVSYTKNDWRNRNKLKSPSGAIWITIPVGGVHGRLIHEVELQDPSWQRKHWATVRQLYSKSPHFGTYSPWLRDIYEGQIWESLSKLNQHLIRYIAQEHLGIRTEFRDSREFNAMGQKLDRLLALVAETGASRYVSGPAAKGYIDPSRFQQAGLELVWKDYAGYPEYPQNHPPFDHAVSILDLLFNVGPDAPWYIWGWRDGSIGPG